MEEERACEMSGPAALFPSSLSEADRRPCPWLKCQLVLKGNTFVLWHFFHTPSSTPCPPTHDDTPSEAACPPPPPIGHQVTLKTEYRLRFDGVWLDGENSLCTCMKAEHTIKPELYYYKTESPVCYRKNYKMPSHHRFLPVRVRACKKNISKDSHHQFALPDLWLISRTDSGELWQRCNGLCLPVAGRQPRNTWLNKAGRVW